MDEILNLIESVSEGFPSYSTISSKDLSKELKGDGPHSVLSLFSFLRISI